MRKSVVNLLKNLWHHLDNMEFILILPLLIILFVAVGKLSGLNRKIIFSGYPDLKFEKERLVDIAGVRNWSELTNDQSREYCQQEVDDALTSLAAMHDIQKFQEYKKLAEQLGFHTKSIDEYLQSSSNKRDPTAKKGKKKQ